MGRWMKQTDTLIIAALLVGLFVFRFGDESWAAVAPHVRRAQNTLSAQFDRVTTSSHTSATPTEAPNDVTATLPVNNSQTVPTTPVGFQTRVVIGPSCPPVEYHYGCHH